MESAYYENLLFKIGGNVAIGDVMNVLKDRSHDNILELIYLWGRDYSKSLPQLISEKIINNKGNIEDEDIIKLIRFIEQNIYIYNK